MGSDEKEYVRNEGGGGSKRVCAYDGGWGSNFCHIRAYVLIE